MTVVPEQEHRGVVVQRPGRMPRQVLAHGLQSAPRVGLLEQVRPVAEGVESAACVPGLGDAVGIQQHLLAVIQQRARGRPFVSDTDTPPRI